jgi:hypothetical protein
MPSFRNRPSALMVNKSVRNDKRIGNDEKMRDEKRREYMASSHCGSLYLIFERIAMDSSVN